MGRDFFVPSTSADARAAFDSARPRDDLSGMPLAERAWAVLEIQKLPLRYARCFNQKDWGAWGDLFTDDFYYDTPEGRWLGSEGILQILKDIGPYDRILSIFACNGAEIEILSPTTARGIVSMDFIFYNPGDHDRALPPLPGDPVVKPGEKQHTHTYYYQTYEKINDRWKIKTSDHYSFDQLVEQAGIMTLPNGIAPGRRA